MTEKRTVYVKEDNEWYEIDFEDLCEGMLFKMYEDDDTLVEDMNGRSEFTALGDSEIGENGICGINCNFNEKVKDNETGN